MAKKLKIPETDSIHELAAFWDSHEITDFDHELEEVHEPVFIKNSETCSISVTLEAEEIPIILPNN